MGNFFLWKSPSKNARCLMTEWNDRSVASFLENKRLAKVEGDYAQIMHGFMRQYAQGPKFYARKFW